MFQSRYIPRRPIFKTIHLDKTLTLTIDSKISYATEVQLDMTIYFIGTFVTEKKKTISTTIPEETTQDNQHEAPQSQKGDKLRFRRNILNSYFEKMPHNDKLKIIRESSLDELILKFLKKGSKNEPGPST